jgi:phenylpropionate dioxygenase-like ring-hydroxylating dioxygenase large terminal subunit
VAGAEGQRDAGAPEHVDRTADAGRAESHHRRARLLFAAGEDPEWIADYTRLDDQVGAEDRVLVESVQRGMASGVLEHGELLLPSEELIAVFQRWVSDGLQTPSRGNRSDHDRERISSPPS